MQSDFVKPAKLIVAVLALLIAKSSYPFLAAQPPSPCDSDYLEAAKSNFTKLLDATDKVVPAVSPEKITEFEAKRSEINQFCPLAPMGLPLEVMCRTRDDYMKYQPIWQKLTDDPVYMQWTINKEVAFLRGVPAEFDRFARTDNVERLFNYIQGDIWLLGQLGSYYRTLERLQVGQPKSAELTLASMKQGEADSAARQSLFDVLKCTALKNRQSSKTATDKSR